MYIEYLNALIQFLEGMKRQGEAITKAATLVADTIMSGGMVYTFGGAHSQLLAMEVQGRAGGLYPVVQIMDPLWGRAERVEGFTPVLLEGLPLKAGDTVFIISNSGRNPGPIDLAMRMKELGLQIIVVTSLSHSRSVSSRHSSDKKLYELGDVVLDTGAPPGDACMELKGLPVKTGPVSTVLGAAMMNAVMIQAIQYLLERGETPPVLLSSNLDGGDEHNAGLIARYGRVPSAFGLHM